MVGSRRNRQPESRQSKPSAVRVIELTNYGDEDIPAGPRLSAYPLHTDQWRQAFLDRLTMVGYIALIEATNHFYDTLIVPKDFHCALVAQLAGVNGSGKLAIYNALRNFLNDFLTVTPLPPSRPDESLEHWHARVMARWERVREREKLLIIAYASILNGDQPLKPATPVHRFAKVLTGPWASPADIQRSMPPPRDRFEVVDAALRPSIADPEFVESLVRRMLEDARTIPLDPDHKQEMSELVAMWAQEFSPDNPAYAQKWSCPEGLSISLRLKGYGNDSPPEDFNAPIKDLLMKTLRACLRADADLSEGQIECDQSEFWIDCAVEDCQCLLRGYDNPAD